MASACCASAALAFSSAYPLSRVPALAPAGARRAHGAVGHVVLRLAGGPQLRVEQRRAVGALCRRQQRAEPVLLQHGARHAALQRRGAGLPGAVPRGAGGRRRARAQHGRVPALARLRRALQELVPHPADGGGLVLVVGRRARLPRAHLHPVLRQPQPPAGAHICGANPRSAHRTQRARMSWPAQRLRRLAPLSPRRCWTGRSGAR